MGKLMSSLSTIAPDEADQPLIADVRTIPFNLLQHDPDCDSLVAREMGQHSGSSRVDVAAFNSSI